MSPWSPKVAGSPDVTVVLGPPGSGKTTYVLEHKHRGDLILDLDAIYSALSGLGMHDNPKELLGYVIAARDGILMKLHRPSECRRAWLITIDPVMAERWQRQYKADVVEFDDVHVVRAWQSRQRVARGR